jgi:hypothetical protein
MEKLMAVYKGLVLRDSFARVNDARLRIVLVTTDNLTIEFPETVTLAFVQATNWFPNDRITFEALTVYGEEPNQLTFERLRNSSGSQSVGFFSFEVDTGSNAEAKGTYREG